MIESLGELHDLLGAPSTELVDGQHDREDTEGRDEGPDLFDGHEALAVDLGLETAHDVEPQGVRDDVGGHRDHDGRRSEELEVALVAPSAEDRDDQSADRGEHRGVLLPAHLLLAVSLEDQDGINSRARDDQHVAHDDHCYANGEAEGVHERRGGNHEARADPRPDDPAVIEQVQLGGQSGRSLLLEASGPTEAEDNDDPQHHRDAGMEQELHSRHLFEKVLHDYPVNGVQATVCEAQHDDVPHGHYPPFLGVSNLVGWLNFCKSAALANRLNLRSLFIFVALFLFGNLLGSAEIIRDNFLEKFLLKVLYKFLQKVIPKTGFFKERRKRLLA